MVESRLDRDDHGFAAQWYAVNAAKVLYDAMGRAPTITPKDIRDAIAATKGFQGATGTITMDAKRNADKPLVVVQIREGKFRYVATANGNK